MTTQISNDETETALRNSLISEGYELTQKLSHGETGPDVVAIRGNETIHFEVIGYKSSGSARARDFYEVFFRSVSRLGIGARRCVIVLPHLAEVGLPARAAQHREAWVRIGRAFPELEIWLVDVSARAIKKTTWIEWASKTS